MIKVIFIANIIVAGWISIISTFYPVLARETIIENAFNYSESIRLVGTLWGAIFIISLIGLLFPKSMSFIFFFQFLYKLFWLIFVCMPAIINGSNYPKSMSLFFLIWVIILPFVIPWSRLFSFNN